jgi:hypothetical protein
MTLHFLTIHHHASRWIKPQVLHIHSYCSNFKIWSIFSEIDITKYKPLFFFLQEGKGNEQHHSEQDTNYASQHHWQSLNELTKIVCKDSSVKDEDIIIWIDSDTLILKQINNYLTDKLNEYDFCSIQRPENGGDLIPHPSFAFCRVGFARNYNITWEGYLKGNPPVDQKFEGIYDTGGKLYSFLTEEKIKWFKLKRTNSLTHDPVLFSIYDEAVYHHGAGSRKGYANRSYTKFQAENDQLFFDTHNYMSHFIFQKIQNGYLLNYLNNTK